MEVSGRASELLHGALLSRRSALVTRTDRETRQRPHIRRQGFDRDEVRKRTRALEEDHVLVASLLDRAADNIVGPGFRLQVKSQSDSWNREVEKRWNGWEEEGADVRGLDSFSELLCLVLRSYMRDGDVGTILLREGSLQAVEGDVIQTPMGMHSNPLIDDGVEMNPAGRPIRFHLEDYDANGKKKTSAIPARDFIFMSMRKRLSETRGWSVFASVLPRIGNLGDYEEAVIVASLMAACFGLVIESENSGQSYRGLQSVKNADGTNQKELVLEPGMMKFLSPGEKVQQVNPSHPKQNHAEYIRIQLRMIGISMGFPLELALLDFSETNLSSIRAGLLQAQRRFRRLQKMLVSRYLGRSYRWKVSKWMKDGTIPRRDDAFDHAWIAPGWPWIDPDKEIKSALLAVDAGFKSLTDVASEQGYDFDDLMATRARELETMKREGVPIVHSVNTRDPEQQAQQEETDSDADDDDETDE